MSRAESPEDRDFNELRLQVFRAGWVRRNKMLNGDGTVTLEFREAPYTSDFTGMITRRSVGKTEAEALQNLLDQIEKEAKGAESRDV